VCVSLSLSTLASLALRAQLNLKMDAHPAMTKTTTPQPSIDSTPAATTIVIQPPRKKPESRTSMDSGSLHHGSSSSSSSRHPPPSHHTHTSTGGPGIVGSAGPLLTNTDLALEGVVKNFMRSEKYARKIKVIVKSTSVPGRQSKETASLDIIISLVFSFRVVACCCRWEERWGREKGKCPPYSFSQMDDDICM